MTTSCELSGRIEYVAVTQMCFRIVTLGSVYVHPGLRRLRGAPATLRQHPFLNRWAIYDAVALSESGRYRRGIHLI